MQHSFRVSNNSVIKIFSHHDNNLYIFTWDDVIVEGSIRYLSVSLISRLSVFTDSLLELQDNNDYRMNRNPIKPTFQMRMALYLSAYRKYYSIVLQDNIITDYDYSLTMYEIALPRLDIISVIVSKTGF